MCEDVFLGPRASVNIASNSAYTKWGKELWKWQDFSFGFCEYPWESNTTEKCYTGVKSYYFQKERENKYNESKWLFFY